MNKNWNNILNSGNVNDYVPAVLSSIIVECLIELIVLCVSLQIDSTLFLYDKINRGEN